MMWQSFMGSLDLYLAPRISEIDSTRSDRNIKPVKSKMYWSIILLRPNQEVKHARIYMADISYPALVSSTLGPSLSLFSPLIS